MADHLTGRHIAVSRRELYEALRKNGPLENNSKRFQEFLRHYVKGKFSIQNCSEALNNELSRGVFNYIQLLLKRWKKSHRHAARFESDNLEWLQSKIVFSKSAGRTVKPFSACGARSQKNKVRELVQSRSPEELQLAAEVSLRTHGKNDAAKLVHETTLSPLRASKIGEAYNSSKKNIRAAYTTDEALALMIDLKLTKHQYISLNRGAKERNFKELYPSYDKIQFAKLKCYPGKESFITTDTMAEVKLQPLLDHTVQRLAEAQKDVLETSYKCCNGKMKSLQIIYKWGLDGCGSHNRYKQKFSGENNHGLINDSDMLVTSLVPLQLYHGKLEKKTIIWQNPRTSSTTFCRPIRFQHVKETPEITRNEFSHVEEQIKLLQPSVITVDGNEISVTQKLIKTMVDGKACNSATSHRSTQTCYICKAAPKDMNKLSTIKDKTCDIDTYSFGLSPLLAYIRFFECLLHIAYRLDIQRWQVRGTDDKIKMETRKKTIIEHFRQKMGLLVDTPKQGFGTTNDGNTARRFFNDPEAASQITGIDEQLIRRFSVILNAISSGYDIDEDAFEKYTTDTAKLYVQLYNWYYMPISVHKILIHGPSIIKESILPIGQLSEDVQEARHKEIRRFREHNTRKSSRVNTNTDLMNILLISSAPLISSIRPLPKKKSSCFSSAVLSLLKAPQHNGSIEDQTTLSETDSDSE